MHPVLTTLWIPLPPQAEYKRRIVDVIEAGRKKDADDKVRLQGRKKMYFLQKKTAKVVHRRDFAVLAKV
jgi:hypothetical protein